MIPFKTLRYTLVLILLLTSGLAGAQIVATNDTAINCTDTITLRATVGSAIGTSLTMSDDVYSGVINIGFPFTWYGNTYTQCVISSNNYVTFNLSYANGGSPWSITNSNPSSSNPLNAAMGPWQDINPGVGGTVKYATVGSPPNRIFVVEYCNVPMFSCTNLQFSSQIQLHENGNYMETHIISKPLCSSWNSGQAIHSTHNINGTAATIVPGRNANSQWSTTNEGYRFTPAAGPSYTISTIPFAPVIVGATSGSITWKSNGVVVGTGDSLVVSPGTTTAYVASISGGCAGITFTDTVVVSTPSPPNVTISASMPDSSIIYEGCGTSVVNFIRPASNLGLTDTLVIVTSGTATEGTDYPAIPDTIIMPPGMGTYSIPISAFMDAFPEGPESITIAAHITDPCMVATANYHLFLNEAPPIFVNTNMDTTVCPNSSVQLVASAYGGVPGSPYTFNWDNGVSNDSQLVQPTGTTTYIVTVTDSCGLMIDSDTVTITVMLNLVAAAGSDMVMCEEDSVMLNGAGSNSVVWSPSATLSNNTILNPIAKPSVTTDYVITVTDGYCFDSDTVTVFVHPKPNLTITPSDTLICLSASVLLTATGADNYTWAPTNTLNSPTGSSVVATPDVSTRYNLVGTLSTGCKDTTSVMVYVNPPLYLETWGDTTLCPDSVELLLSAYGTGGNGGPYNYNWTPDLNLNTTSGQEVIATADETTTYIVTLTDNCETPAVSDSVVIKILPTPEIVVNPSAFTGCEPLSVSFQNNSTGDISWSWNFGNGKYSNKENPEVNFNQDGVFYTSVTMMNDQGCKSVMDSLRISVWPTPTADFDVSPEKTTIISPKVSFFDRSYYDITWRTWDIAGIHTETSSEFTYDFLEPGNFPIKLVVGNQYGCLDSANFTLEVDGAFLMYIPNAFTPDGDGLNDYFRVVADHAVNFEMKIFNRWGNLIFQSNNPEIGWDGTFNGTKAPLGVYVYTVTAEGPYPETFITKEGTITLIR